MNSTLIALVFKIPNPTKMTEYRPISCCNLVYKFIIKILAERLKNCLNLFISRNQCAFVEGRLMVENVLIALGFPTQFIKWLRACITTPMFFVVFNGNLASYFPRKNGVRQGDLLSPQHFCYLHGGIIYNDKYGRCRRLDCIPLEMCQGPIDTPLLCG
ncbi:hypothetical protein SLE2022_310770 [Rubroshorea leprosula]